MKRSNSQYLFSLGRSKSISKELGKPPYSAVYMKEKLQEHFGEKIAIITVNNRNVVTFRSTVATMGERDKELTIIREFYKQSKVDDYGVEQIIKESSRSEESLDSLRYSRFCQKITTAVYHSLRAYHQVQQWRGVNVALLPPEANWLKTSGWKTLPVRTDPPAAHASLLEIVRCNCDVNLTVAPRVVDAKKKTRNGLLGCMWYL